MSLANLNINVTANVAPVVNAMTDVRVNTGKSMSDSAAAVKDFQAKFSQGAGAVQSQAQLMSSSMSAASNSINQSSAKASDAIGNISASADASVVSLKDMSRAITEGQQKANQMFGDTQQMDKQKSNFKEFADQAGSWAKTKIEIAAIGLLFGGVAAAAFGAYTTINTLIGVADWVGGLFTGESYKSKNIDALIATNKEVVALQGQLQMAAVDAQALNDAIGRIGVDKGDYASVYEKTESAIRSNTEELDRLGVKYKDANGKFLETNTILANARKELDQYTEGWDRNAAAAAMGLGTYKQINDYLKVNQEEVQRSKSRLDEYGLALGPEAQKYLTDYQQAMREFNNELKLMGDGFKRVFADQVIPAYTTFANTLKDGWPVAVNAVRYAMAQITSLLYGLKTAFDIVTDTIVGDVKAQYQVFAGIYEASQKALMGDFSGAKSSLVKGWDDAKASIAKIGTDIVRDATNNGNAMRLAWGFDNKGGAGNGMPGSGKNKGKSYKGAVAPEEEESSSSGRSDVQAWLSAHDKYLSYLKSFTAKETEIIKTSAQQQLEANQEAWDWGLISQQAYLAKKWALNVNEIGREIQLKQEEIQRFKDEVAAYKDATDAKGAAAYHEALKKQTDAEKDLVALEGKLAVSRMQNANEYKKALFDQNQKLKELAATQLQLNGDNLTAAQLQQQVTSNSREFLQMSAEAQEAQKAIWAEQNKSLTDSNSVISGMKAGLHDYAKTAQDVGSQVKSFTSSMMKGMEDALVNFVKTGKMNFKDLANSIISDLIRIAIQKSITGPLGDALGSGISSLFGQANGGAWSNGVQMFANGGVVSSPTMFGMAGGGLGVMGEAGPEAVMPLSRTSNGRLGVDVVGGLKGATSPNVTILIENKSGGEVKQGSTNVQFDGKGFVISTIIEDVKNNGPLRGLMAGAGAY